MDYDGGGDGNGNRNGAGGGVERGGGGGGGQRRKMRVVEKGEDTGDVIEIVPLRGGITGERSDRGRARRADAVAAIDGDRTFEDIYLDRVRRAGGETLRSLSSGDT